MITIGKKLLFGKIFMLLLLLIIVLSSIYSINNLSKTATKMEVEYNEVNIAQELQINFQQILIAIKNYQLKGENKEISNFEQYLSRTKEKIAKSKKIITNNHNKKHLTNFENEVTLVESLTRKYFKLDFNADKIAATALTEEISSISILAMGELNEISVESEKEMDQYIIENNETNRKGKRLVILIGLIAAFSLVVGSFFFLKAIMIPIKNLKKATENISSSNLSAKTPVNSQDEIGDLINSFNNMIGILHRTTISRDYFDNILGRMNDSLIITDAKNNITVVNQATLDLLGYTEEEIIGLPFRTIIEEEHEYESLSENKTISDLIEQKQLHNIYNTYFSKKGEKIPVLFSGSLMVDVKGIAKGMICIANHHSIENVTSENTAFLNLENHAESTMIKTVDEIPLTQREREIMKLIAEERSNQEIAELLFISVRTVETHRKNIMQKLHTKSVIALVKYASLNGII